MTFLSFMIIASTLLRTPTTADLTGAGLAIGAGKGRINGHDTELAVLAVEPGASLAKRLQQALAGTYTVTDFPALGIITVADLKSASCMTCAALDAAPIEELTRKTYVITLAPLPNGGSLAIGSPAGALAEALARRPTEPLTYEGEAFGPLAAALTIETQVAYVFNGTRVFDATAALTGSAAGARARLSETLIHAGFAPLAGSHTAESASGAPEIWQRDKMFASITLQPPTTKNPTSTRVLIHEVTVP